jgi:prophage DNA circulation protein
LAKEADELLHLPGDIDVDRCEIIRSLLEEKLKILSEIDEEILGLCEVKDIEQEIEESTIKTIVKTIKTIVKTMKTIVKTIKNIVKTIKTIVKTMKTIVKTIKNIVKTMKTIVMTKKTIVKTIKTIVKLRP